MKITIAAIAAIVSLSPGEDRPRRYYLEHKTTTDPLHVFVPWRGSAASVQLKYRLSTVLPQVFVPWRGSAASVPTPPAPTDTPPAGLCPLARIGRVGTQCRRRTLPLVQSRSLSPGEDRPRRYCLATQRIDWIPLQRDTRNTSLTSLLS